MARRQVSRELTETTWRAYPISVNFCRINFKLLGHILRITCFMGSTYIRRWKKGYFHEFFLEVYIIDIAMKIMRLSKHTLTIHKSIFFTIFTLDAFYIGLATKSFRFFPPVDFSRPKSFSIANFRPYMVFAADVS